MSLFKEYLTMVGNGLKNLPNVVEGNINYYKDQFGILEEDKKQVTNVEKKTNFQPIQSEKSKNEVYIINGYRYKWDGNEYKLIQ